MQVSGTKRNDGAVKQVAVVQIVQCRKCCRKPQVKKKEPVKWHLYFLNMMYFLFKQDHGVRDHF